MISYSHKVKINPVGLLTFGFVGLDGAYSISGYGLGTFGFVWGVADIWVPTDECAEVTWVACACAEACN